MLFLLLTITTLVILPLHEVSGSAVTCERADYDRISFCSSTWLSWNVTKDTPVQQIDGTARQTYTGLLVSYSASTSVITTKECSDAVQRYVCAVYFPRCSNVSVKLPCRDVCSAYCSACKQTACPCYDLPEHDSYDTCVPLTEYHSEEKTQSAGQSLNLVSSLTLAAAAMSIVGGVLATM